jgi:hypothetical protein
MISAETMKWRLQEGKLTDFDLVFWKGAGRVVSAADDRLSLQVRGKRADYTWERVRDTWLRLQVNHTLTVDELGGGHDAVGLVSLFAAFQIDEVEVVSADGLLRLRNAKGRPVRPDPGPALPDSWAPLQRKIDGQ